MLRLRLTSVSQSWPIGTPRGDALVARRPMGVKRKAGLPAAGIPAKSARSGHLQKAASESVEGECELRADPLLCISPGTSPLWPGLGGRRGPRSDTIQLRPAFGPLQRRPLIGGQGLQQQAGRVARPTDPRTGRHLNGV